MYIVANWKMNQSLGDAQSFVRGLGKTSDKMSAEARQGLTVVIAPSHLHLALLNEECKGCSPHAFSFAGQDLSSHPKGAFTGDVSARDLKEIGAEFVIIGHSERRQNHHENGDLLCQKLARAFESDLVPIFCIGEPLEIRVSQQTQTYLDHQLREILPVFEKLEENKPFLIAYEPIWAIGTGRIPEYHEIDQTHQDIRSFFGNNLESLNPSILYGGSVTSDNAEAILNLKSVHGALIGGASLQLDSFQSIIETSIKIRA